MTDSDEVVQQEPFRDRRGWPPEEHQVSDHVADAERLCADRREVLPAIEIGFVAQQHLHAAGDRGQGIIDLMAGSGREFGEGFGFRGLKRATTTNTGFDDFSLLDELAA